MTVSIKIYSWVVLLRRLIASVLVGIYLAFPAWVTSFAPVHIAAKIVLGAMLYMLWLLLTMLLYNVFEDVKIEEIINGIKKLSHDYVYWLFGCDKAEKFCKLES